jgi:hypothetical protein
MSNDINDMEMDMSIQADIDRRLTIVEQAIHSMHTPNQSNNLSLDILNKRLRIAETFIHSIRKHTIFIENSEEYNMKSCIDSVFSFTSHGVITGHIFATALQHYIRVNNPKWTITQLRYLLRKVYYITSSHTNKGTVWHGLELTPEYKLKLTNDSINSSLDTNPAM